MSIMSIMDVCSSGLRCEKVRMEVIAQNIANIETTQTSAGGPYQRKIVAFQETLQNQLQAHNGVPGFERCGSTSGQDRHRQGRAVDGL
jgi:flagellar basal-body rod protein FlgC